MKIKLAERLYLETEIPVYQVEYFIFSWKPFEHAKLKLRGYLGAHISWNQEVLEHASIQLSVEQEGKIQVIYHGYVTAMNLETIGKFFSFELEALSASCLLDVEVKNKSFQAVEKTYGEMIKEMVSEHGSQVIRNRDSDRMIGYPVFCLNETLWQFINRMGKKIGVYVIPDLETGKPNLWFGMRKGKRISSFTENDFSMQINPLENDDRIVFQVKDRNFYKIGDGTSYLGENVTITEVQGCFEHGELVFTYGLENKTACKSCKQGIEMAAGQGFWGTVKAVNNEQIKLALEIDHGEETGDYYFPWCPETGNVFYAVPEIGAKALLCFFDAGQEHGMVIHCMNREHKTNKGVENKVLKTKEDDLIQLEKKRVYFSQNDQNLLEVYDHDIFAGSENNLSILAKKKIKIKAKRINISAPEEIKLCQD